MHGDFEAILAVYPAQPGTYFVHGYIDDIPEEEIWLGYELPGADIPNWEEILAATIYKLTSGKLMMGKCTQPWLLISPPGWI